MLKRISLILSLAATLFVMAPVSQADASWSSWWSSWREQRQERLERYRSWWSSKSSDGWSSHAVPELDPGAAGRAIDLLIGGVAYIASRRREEEDAA